MLRVEIGAVVQRAVVVRSIVVTALAMLASGPLISGAPLNQQAASFATQAVGADEAYANALWEGETAFKDRKFVTALDAFRRASALRSRTSPEAWFGMSRASHGLGVFQEAMKSADEALKFVAGRPALEAVIRQHRARLFLALAVYPDDPRWEEAEREFAAAARLDPAFARPSYDRALGLLTSLRDEEGLRELRAVVAAGGTSAPVDAARRLLANPGLARERFVAPSFSITTSSGQTLNSASLRGQVVLLDFWGTWCPPCRAATPTLVALHGKYGGQIVMIGIGVLEQSEQNWREYIQAHGMTWPQYLDSVRDDDGAGGLNGPPRHLVRGPKSVGDIFNVRGYPTYIVIDRDGIIRGRPSLSEIEPAVRKALFTPAVRPER